jgi:predicted phage gp36 major capsid-like protein
MEKDTREVEEIKALVLEEGAWKPGPTRLRELASRARELRNVVEERWEELPQDLRQALEDLARSWEASALADLGALLREVALLSRAVTDGLEERDPAFREVLRRALAEEGTPLEEGELRSLVLGP